MKRQHLVFGLIVFLLIAWYVPVAATAYSAQEIPTFDNWLEQASGPMVSVIASILVSLLVEYWPQYQELDKKWKTASYFAMCLVWAAGCASLRGLLGYVPWSFDPLVWHAIWNAFAAGGIGTLAHQFMRRSAPTGTSR